MSNKREIKFRAWEQIDFLPDKFELVYSEDNLHQFFSMCSCDILQQYTGLKDKNGKNIYEGDIVTAVDLDKYEVSWSPKSLTYTLYKDSFYLIDAIYDYDLEVIGNIYENPELLIECK